MQDVAAGDDLRAGPGEVGQELGDGTQDAHPFAIAPLEEVNNGQVTRPPHQADEQEAGEKQAEGRTKGVEDYPLQPVLIGGGSPAPIRVSAANQVAMMEAAAR